MTPQVARHLPTLRNAVEEMLSKNAVMRTATVAMPNPEPVGKIDHVLIPSDGTEIVARVYAPEGDGPFPILVYFHGGGWVIANLDVYEASARALCNAAEAVVLSVAYRQAPEEPYPAAVNDAYAAVQWAFHNAATINGDANRIAVAGESAGGNLATGTCLRAKKEGGHMPIAQLLIYPVTQFGDEFPSMEENANAKPLNKPMLAWFKKYYLGDNQAAQDDEYVSPLRAADLSGLPPP